MKKTMLTTLAILGAAIPCTTTHAEQSAPKPAKVLLITGGCCHDYEAQKDLLKNGLEKRLNIEVTQIHSADKSPKPPLPTHGNPAYADGFDLVIHDECAAAISDPAVINGIILPHKNGIPGINLHCAMHSYRFGDFQKPVAPGSENAAWFDYLGLQSFRHGPHVPLSIRYTDANHPANKGLSDWTTGKEELYHVVQVMPGTSVLAHGSQKINKNGTETIDDYPIVWVHEYGPEKVRIWSTSLGHFNETVSDDRYLDLVANGVEWALNRPDLRK